MNVPLIHLTLTLTHRASIIQQEITKVGEVNVESVYKPVLIRGTDGEFKQLFFFFL